MSGGSRLHGCDARRSERSFATTARAIERCVKQRRTPTHREIVSWKSAKREVVDRSGDEGDRLQLRSLFPKNESVSAERDRERLTNAFENAFSSRQTRD